MIEREDGAQFGILLHQMIDAHREAAECSRKLWNRIWIVLWVSVGVLAFGAWYSVAQAQSVPAYEGCTLAWDYPEEQASLVQSFGVHIDDRSPSIPLGGSARSIPCANLGLTLGKTHLIKVRAFNRQLGHSPFAEITVDYQAKPTMLAPTNTRIILEWQP